MVCPAIRQPNGVSCETSRIRKEGAVGSVRLRFRLRVCGGFAWDAAAVGYEQNRDIVGPRPTLAELCMCTPLGPSPEYEQ